MNDPHLALSSGTDTARSANNTANAVRAVQRRLAVAVLPPLPPAQLGDARLMPHQREAAARLLRILRQHGGALLADDVGLGKTFTALAVARSYQHAHVLAPAGLVAMWQAALLRAGLPHMGVHSLHRASHHALSAFAEHGAQDAADRRRTLVIIDEAHALRNAATARYRRVAAAVSCCDVLLVSATPLHNSIRDLGALFALFRGTHRHAASEQLMAALVVRRQHVDARPGAARRRATPPPVHIHRPITVPQQRETLDLLLALPAPLPARDGSAAGALIRMGLLRAWCSSDAALTHAINRRLQRASAMRDALREGRHLTETELRAWLIDDESSCDMQLGFVELLASHRIEPDSQQSALERLDAHSQALRALREHHVAHAHADELRAGYLRAICRRHAGTPVVAFSQHARTVQALFRALSDIAGVGLLTSTQARIASGTVTRPELLGWFAPRAQGRPPPPPSRRVHLLLATDLIAEGVNLQDAAVVVHLDVPWTHALRAQRTGRVVRLGSTHALTHEYRLRASPAARRMLRAEYLVSRKAALAARAVGDGQVHEARARRSAVTQAMRWEARLLEWALREEGEERPTAGASQRGAYLRIGHGIRGAILLLRGAHGVRLLACVRRGGRWWVSTRTDALLALSDGEQPSRCRSRARFEEGPPSAQQEPTEDERPISVAALRRIVRRWWKHEQARQAAGTTDEADSVQNRGLNHTQRQAIRWLQQRVASLTTVQRARHGEMLRQAQDMIARASSAGAAAALRQWMTASCDAVDALPDWRRYPALVAAEQLGDTHASIGARRPPCIELCLFVEPP